MSDFDWMQEDIPSDALMLDTEALGTRVTKAAKEDDILEIRRLLDAANGYPDSLGVPEQIVGTLLRGDFDGISQKTLDQATIKKWCLAHAHVLVEQCPKLFERWASPVPRYVRCVALAHATLDAKAKTALLTAPTTFQQSFLCQSLQEHPRLWQELSPAWVGAKGSDLRESARALGWNETMLPTMMFGLEPNDFCAEILTAMSYPYSVWVLSRGHLLSPPTRMLSSGSLVEARQGANPRDMVLAQQILKKTGKHNHSIVKHPTTPDTTDEERAKVEQMVDMHVMLGSLGALRDCLVHDVLPGIDAPIPPVVSVQELMGVDFGGMV